MELRDPDFVCLMLEDDADRTLLDNILQASGGVSVNMILSLHGVFQLELHTCLLAQVRTLYWDMRSSWQRSVVTSSSPRLSLGTFLTLGAHLTRPSLRQVRARTKI